MDVTTRVVTLHELCRLELRELLARRLMPRGWDREKDRQISKLMPQANRWLDAALELRPNALLRYPVNAVLQLKLNQAAQERLRENMVRKMVELFSQLPQQDQEGLCALGDTTDDLIELGKARQLLSTVRESLEALGRLTCARRPGLNPTTLLLDVHTMEKALAAEDARLNKDKTYLESLTEKA